MQVVNLQEKLASFSDTWSPKVVGALNGQHVKLAKLEGEFIWHQHAEEDELFLVLQGELEIELRDRRLRLREGEFCIVPRGIEHKPVAHGEAHVLLFEPTSTRNTGDIESERTVEDPEWI